MCRRNLVGRAALNAAGRRYIDGLERLSKLQKSRERDGWNHHDFACRVAETAFGVLPMDGGPNRLNDAEVAALVPLVEAAADRCEVVLEEKERIRAYLAPWWRRWVLKALRLG